MTAPTSAAWQQCVKCGVEAPVEQLHADQGQWQCPACVEPDERAGLEIGESISLAAFAAICWYYVTTASDIAWNSNVGQIAVIGVCSYIFLTIVHESGHAVMAKLTGRTLVAVGLGHGSGRLLRWTMGSVLFEVRANITGGWTAAIGDTGRFREALYLLGGVAAELIVLVIAWLWEPTTNIGEVVRLALMLGAMYDLVNNLWPRTVNMPPDGRLSNDGLLLVELARRKGAKASTIEVTANDVKFALRAQTDDPELVLANAAAEFATDPDRELPRYRFGMCLVTAERWQEAVEVLTPLVEWDQSSNELQALVLNNLAWSALMTFDPVHIADAERWSGRAVELVPVQPAYSSTRGSALVMADRPDEGMPLLLRAYKTCGDQANERALVCGFAAMGAAGQDKRVLARDRYAAMVNYDPTCPIRRQVEARIAEHDAIAFADLIATSIESRVKVEELLDDEEQLVAMANLALCWVNGLSRSPRLDDEHVVHSNDQQPVTVSAIRAVARRVLAEHVLAATEAPQH